MPNFPPLSATTTGCWKSACPRHTASTLLGEGTTFPLASLALTLRCKAVHLGVPARPRTSIPDHSRWTTVTHRHLKSTHITHSTLHNLSTRRLTSAHPWLARREDRTLAKSLKERIAGEAELVPYLTANMHPSSLMLRASRLKQITRTSQVNLRAPLRQTPTLLITSTLSSLAHLLLLRRTRILTHRRTQISSSQRNTDSPCHPNKHLPKRLLSRHSPRNNRLRPSSKATGNHQYRSNRRTPNSIGKASTIADIPRNHSRLLRKTHPSSQQWRRVSLIFERQESN